MTFRILMTFDKSKNLTVLLLSQVEDLGSSPPSGLMTFRILMTFERRNYFSTDGKR
jgi:hypothetical protein